MIGGDGVGQVLQKHGLAGTGRSDDQAALTFTNWGEQIHDAGADVFAHRLQLDPLLRIERGEVVEKDLVTRLFGRLEVDRLDLDQRKIFFTFVRRTDLAADGVAGLQIEFADLRRGNVNVIRTRKVVVVGRAEKTVAIRQDLKYAFSEDVAFFFALRLKDLEDQVLLAQAAGTR